MEKDSIVEGNKLIAEFMGAIKTKSPGFVKEDYFDIPDWPREKWTTVYGGSYETTTLYWERDLRYHTSWDWLMPVVEKINKLDLSNIKHDHPQNPVRVEINVGGYCEISAGGWWDHEGAWEQQLCEFNSYMPELGMNGQPPLITKLWTVTVQFITWYNSLTPKQ